jgi:hypothetical protein
VVGDDEAVVDDGCVVAEVDGLLVVVRLVVDGVPLVDGVVVVGGSPVVVGPDVAVDPDVEVGRVVGVERTVADVLVRWVAGGSPRIGATLVGGRVGVPASSLLAVGPAGPALPAVVPALRSRTTNSTTRPAMTTRPATASAPPNECRWL